MANVSVTYTFSNSTTADASQVNQCFTDIINGTSDGTKDFSISALTCAGNVAFNGNTTIGNASSDDLTITASLASTIAIKTTNTYNIGSATKGLQYIYYGSSAGSNTTRVGGSAVTSDVQITLPDVTGTLRLIGDTQSKTTTYTALVTDGLIKCDTSGAAWTLTLYTAVGNTGKRLKIKKTTSDTNNLTVDGNGSETIDGALTAIINKQNEVIEIQSDGANWQVVNRYSAGGVAQRVYASTAAVDTTTTQIPMDDTIPQITEGKEFLTATIVPKSTTNRLLIEVSIWGAEGGASYFTGALFQDSTANALAARPIYCDAANIIRQCEFKYEMAAGTTSSTTFRVRAGPNGATTFTFNGQAAARLMGGVGYSSIVITEVWA